MWQLGGQEERYSIWSKHWPAVVFPSPGAVGVGKAGCLQAATCIYVSDSALRGRALGFSARATHSSSFAERISPLIAGTRLFVFLASPPTVPFFPPPPIYLLHYEPSLLSPVSPVLCQSVSNLQLLRLFSSLLPLGFVSGTVSLFFLPLYSPVSLPFSAFSTSAHPTCSVWSVIPVFLSVRPPCSHISPTR